jgi:phosphonate transport system ATP-binding protein
MIFQRFNLVGRLSVLTNGLTGRLNHKPRLPKLFGLFTDRERDIAIDALAALGMNDHALRLGRSQVVSSARLRVPTGTEGQA